MPREMINGQDGRFNLHVGWSPDQDVQIGIETVDGSSLLMALYGSRDSLERVGRRAIEAGWQAEIPDERGGSAAAGDAYRAVGLKILSVVEGAPLGGPEPAGDVWTGIWTTLTRFGCNRAIKMVRRGRDVAFGRDE